MRKLTIAIDYDGTIVDGKSYPEQGKFRFLARPVLKWMCKQDYTLILWTCRGGQPLETAKSFLKSNGIVFDHCNENAPSLIKFFKNDCRKVGCDLFIDDKAGFVFWPWVFFKVLLAGTTMKLSR